MDVYLEFVNSKVDLVLNINSDDVTSMECMFEGAHAFNGDILHGMFPM